ncbi:MAG: ERCC4 domain-containing protein [Conexivisphaerales archaeon]
MSEKVLVVCDERERASGVPQELALLGVVTRFAMLPVGDYIVSPSTAVERKSVRDFVTSLYDGRLFKQVSELGRTYSNHILIVEGDPAEIANIAYNIKSYYGALSSVMLDFNTKTIFTPSPRETAIALDAMARRLAKSKGEKWVTMYQARPKGNTLPEQQMSIVMSLPGIGQNLAKRLLLSFSTVRKIMNASSQQLASVQGVGTAKAERIVKVLTTPYSDSDNAERQKALEESRE